MKKIFFYLAMLTILISVSCGKSNKEKLIGTWKIKSIEGISLTASEIETTITFSPDGKFTSKMSEEIQSSGTWTLSDDQKKITTKFSEGDSTILNIVSLDNKIFVYTVDAESPKNTLEKQ